MIVDFAHQYEQYKRQIIDQTIVCHAIVQNPIKHLVDSVVIGWYIKIVDGEEFTILMEHPEALFTVDPYETFATSNKCYIVDSDILSYNNYKMTSNMEDATVNSYLQYGTIPEYDSSMLSSFYRKKLGPASSNLVIDPIKLQQHYRELVNKIPIDQQTSNEYYTTVKQVYHAIEKNGIAVDLELYQHTFGNNGYVKGNKAYTKYNLFTSTGRPSNRFAGVNYAALNRDDNTRQCFISRYPQGKLVEIDFTSYHPRILADLTKYAIADTENIYEHLAKQYFGNNPTQEQIAQAKEMTFRQLYGGVSRQYQGIEYYQRIQVLTDALWKTYKQQGYVSSIYSKRKVSNIEDPTPTKLLNYFIQLHETEQNVLLLSQVFAKLPQDILPVLYTYDSVLFDIPQGKEQILCDILLSIIPSKYPFKTKIGDNYKKMD